MTTALSERQVSIQRQMGAYYTPSSAAEYMADWVLRGDQDTILEPSFGDGAFLRALKLVAANRELRQINVRGVELDERALGEAISGQLIHESEVASGDFLAQAPEPVDAVIGNPPYVRLRHVDSAARSRALAVAHDRLASGMEPSGSIWMPFVVHASNFLRIGGRLAFVLPYELTYVRYARPLWQFLGQNFSSLRVVRVFERVFPDILQDVVLLFADGHGSRTSTVEFETYEAVADLARHRPETISTLDVERIVRGERDFVRALLSEELCDLLDRLALKTRPAADVMKLRIGYVSGDKTFFHPSPETIKAYKLPLRALRRAVTTTRSLRGKGLFTSQMPSYDTLFHPASNRTLSAAEAGYVAEGARRGVANRYKCKVRDPWYLVPGVLEPDLILSVFSSTPLLMVNDAGCVASNSLLCGYLAKDSDPALIAASWYTSLTLLECELRVHSLGGGVMVMIPGEASEVRIAMASTSGHLVLVDEALKRGDIRGAYELGDEAVLRAELALSEREVELVREGVRVLTRWRESAQ